MDNSYYWKNKKYDYIRYLVLRDLSNLTIRKYIKDIEDYYNWLDKSNNTAMKVLEYKKFLKNKYKVSSVNSKLNSLNRYLLWLGKDEYRVKYFKIQENTSISNVLDRDEYLILLNAAIYKRKWKLYYIMRTLALTGIRIGELKYITVESLDNNQVEIYNKGKYRVIYLGENLREVLKIYCKENQLKNGVIFRGRNDKAISPKTVWKNLKKIACEAGVIDNKVYPHSFRHLFAKEYMSVSSNISELADILGHRSLDTTRRYTRTSVDEKIKLIDALNM